MRETSLKISKNWLIFLPDTDSTNMYAIRRINDGLSGQGEVIWTLHQHNGRGQREKKWEDEPGNSLLMSVILHENLANTTLFQLTQAVALAITTVLKRIFMEWEVRIKWPNDIYINDKKACGILIENGFRGSKWLYSVVGIGLNVSQERFPEDLPNATSLLRESGKLFALEDLLTEIRAELLSALQGDMSQLLHTYNHLLYRRNDHISYTELTGGHTFEGKVWGVNEDGEMVISVGSDMKKYSFGEIQWNL